jgi:hypothetical protein
LNQILKQVSENYDLSREEEDCPAEVKEAIAVELEKAPPLKRFAEHIRNAKSIAKVNRVLDNVWDEADYSKVWCGVANS